MSFLNKLRSVFHNMERFNTIFPLIFFYSKDSVAQLLNHVWLFANPWTEAHQAPLSFTISWSFLKFISIELVSPLFIWFPRQEYWSGLSFSSPGDLPNSGIKPTSPILQADSLPLSHHRRFYLAPLDLFSQDFHKSYLKIYLYSNSSLVLEKTLESLLDCQEIQTVHPKRDRSWVFLGRTDQHQSNIQAETPIIWPPDVKSWLIWKDPDVGKDWGQEEKGTTEDEMVGWHHRLNGHGFG